MKKILTMITLCGVCCAYAQNTPPFAASTKTWKIESPDGKIKQTWSDYIAVPACNKTDYIVGAWKTPSADCRSYTYRSTTFYYYSHEYVNVNQSALCPHPWRVTNSQDFCDLIAALGGVDTHWVFTDERSWAHFAYRFGLQAGGYLQDPHTIVGPEGVCGLWAYAAEGVGSCRIGTNGTVATCLYIYNTALIPSFAKDPNQLMRVRCVL
jgi:hypothetical protein